MKKLLIAGLVGMVMILHTMALASDIDVNEPRPTVTKWRMSKLIINTFDKQAIVIYRKGYMDGSDFVGIEPIGILRQDKTVAFQGSEFTQFISYITIRIRAGDSLKEAITKAVKIKLGL